jgi:CubicO group peptidase (beta-lactamase class C family)
MSRADAIDDFVKAEMKRQNVPGVVFGIMQDGKLIRSEAYGMADVELNVPVKKDTLFEIGSVTKQFTSMLTMMLVDEGKLSLDDTVGKHMPNAPKTWQPIKVRNLLYQSSGLPEYVFVDGIVKGHSFSPEGFLENVGKVPLDFEPGTTFAYSNTNYYLMALVVEKAGGKSWEEQLTEKIFKPLGMNSSRVLHQYEIVPNRAHGYLLNGKDLMVAYFQAEFSPYGDGGILSTVEDMAKWDAALGERKLLKPESYKLLWSPGTLNSGRSRPYGMAWNISLPGDPPYVGHAGNSAGYSAGLARYTDKKLSVVVMANVYAISGEGLARQIAELHDPSLKPSPWVFSEQNDPNPSRTDRVKKALQGLAQGKADAELMEPELMAPMLTSRAKQFGPGAFRAIQEMEKVAYAGETKNGQDTVVSYRVITKARNFGVKVTYTPAGKVAQVIMRAEPPKAAS